MDLYDRIERLRIMRPMKPMGILSGAHEQIVVSRGIDKFKRLHKLHAMYWEEPSTNKNVSSETTKSQGRNTNHSTNPRSLIHSSASQTPRRTLPTVIATPKKGSK